MYIIYHTACVVDTVTGLSARIDHASQVAGTPALDGEASVNLKQLLVTVKAIYGLLSINRLTEIT